MESDEPKVPNEGGKQSEGEKSILTEQKRQMISNLIE